VTNSTISANSADFGGGIHNYGTLTLGHTIVAGNTAPHGPDGYSFGLITFQGYNLVGKNSEFAFSAVAGDQVGTPGRRSTRDWPPWPTTAGPRRPMPSSLTARPSTRATPASPRPRTPTSEAIPASSTATEIPRRPWTSAPMSSRSGR